MPLNLERIWRNSLFQNISLILIFFSCGYLRFSNLDWGFPHYFHPDENNIASLVLSLPHSPQEWYTQGTFAYGNFISNFVYILLFSVQSVFSLGGKTINLFETGTIIFLLRFISAISSFLLVVLVYHLASTHWNRRVGIVASLLTGFTPGLIQAAHFGTYDVSFAFLILLSFSFLLRYTQGRRLRYYFLSFLALSVASAIKLNALIAVPILLFVYIFINKQKILNVFSLGLLLLGPLFCFSLTLLLSPYYLTSDFRRLLIYEQELVRGVIDIFYTRQFIDTTPLLFQFQSIFPYSLGFVLTAFFPISLMFLTYFVFHRLTSQRNFQMKDLMLILFCVLFLIPFSFVFTKWSRYILPAIPFIILVISVAVDRIPRRFSTSMLFFLVLQQVIIGTSFFQIYSNVDSRVQASEWIHANIPEASTILNETANVVNFPLPSKDSVTHHYYVQTFNYYDIDFQETSFLQLFEALESADYIIVPSRRLFLGMAKHPQNFPRIARYYELLFSGKLGFALTQTYSSFPSLFGFEFVDEQAEETWTVFDHPVVRIYQKVDPHTKVEYAQLFEN